MDIFIIGYLKKIFITHQKIIILRSTLLEEEGTYNKYASLDDATDPLHYYMSHIKFELVELHQMQLMRLEMVTLLGKKGFN